MHGEEIGFGYGFWSLVLVNVGIFVLAGLLLMGAGWHRIHRAQGALVTDGPYAWAIRSTRGSS